MPKKATAKAKTAAKKAPVKKAADVENVKLVTKDISIYELVEKYPDAVPILFDHGMHCLGCAAAQFETIGQAAEAHGVDPDKLIDDINKALKKKK